MQYIHYTCKRIFILTVLIIFSLHIYAQEKSASALDYAKQFFQARQQNNTSLKSANTQSFVLKQVYKSPQKASTSLSIFDKSDNGFAIIAKTNDEFKVIAYSDDNSFGTDSLPRQIKSFLSYLEDSVRYTKLPQAAQTAGTPVVAPLLDEHGIRFNQFNHPEVGLSYTGCMATALAQIMKFHAAEKGTNVKGTGSFCYTYEPYGELCADFENADYSSDELLSYHVAIAMKMRFTTNGSSPADYSGLENIVENFGYYIQGGPDNSYYAKNELDHRRPFYVAIYGEPDNHAVVVDGYDDNDYFHLNFGWGGSFNGYYINSHYLFSTNGLTKFSTNLNDLLYMSPTPPVANKQDSLALLAVHDALGGYEATKWDISKPVCYWPGVLLFNERVTELQLRLQSAPLTTQSIADEIGNLPELKILDINGPINGSLPATITNLSKLEALSIHNTSIYIEPNHFKGDLSFSLPADIDKLTQLESISISNALEGEIPASLGNLVNLQSITIYQNTSDFGQGMLAGTLPPELGNLSQLYYISITNNQLNGSIPSSLVNLPKLEVINFSDNHLSGAIPAMQSSTIKQLNVSNNQITGFNAGNWDCPQLKNADFSNNKIEGDFPSNISDLTSLESLSLYNNQIISLPESMGNLTALKSLRLANNQLSALPKSIGELINLEIINADNNLLTALPDGLALPVNLNSVSAQNNQISYIPDNIGQTQSLYSLLLGNNKIQSIPSGLGNSPELKFIEFNDNLIDSIPASFNNLIEDTQVLLQNNQIQGAIPEGLMTNAYHLRLDNNRFRFNDIPASESLHHGLSEQKPVALKNSVIKVQMGDTVDIDIRILGNFSHPDNEYYWLYYPEFLPRITKPDEFNIMESNPILRIVINEETINNQYYCKVFNPASPYYTFDYLGNSNTAPCLYNLNTEVLSFTIASDEEIIADDYPDEFVTSQAGTNNNSISDGTVTLVPPLKVKRGTVQWEVSEDGETWEVIDENLTNEILKANISNATPQELVLKPVTNAYYRCGIAENDCETLYSENILVKSQGNILYDEVINVTESSKTISVDSIEVIVPKNFHDTDFKLTITKLDNPPAAPDTVLAGGAYDVKVSFGDTFEIPLLIKLKNIDKTLINEKDINKFDAVYYNEHERKWEKFKDAAISLKDSSMVIVTNHLTKIQWWWYADEHRMGFTDVYERNNILVFYKDKDTDFMKLIYGRKQKTQPWHIAEIPLLVQDITEYLSEVMIKYKELGLSVPDDKFKVYVEDLGGDDGAVGILGMIKGYLSISTIISNPIELRQACAHEYMHYMQDFYISAHGGNLFWMEAHATLSDRIVWNNSIIPFCESEDFLAEGRTNKNFAFNSLSNSWDHWDMSVLTNKYFGNRQYYYQAGTFLHYMRSYREGTQKLEPATLLKETPWLQSWRTYLGSYVSKYLDSYLGDEFEDYAKYILSGKNNNFTLLNKNGNPYAFIKSYKNKGKFTHPVSYKFKEGEEQVQKDEINIKVPYMAAKMVLLENTNKDDMTIVKYTRKHDYDVNHKVYHGTYDFLKKEMTYVDITDSTEYNFLLENRNLENFRKKFSHYSFLLLVNKDYIGTSSLIPDFNASFELTAMPVLNMESICALNFVKGENKDWIKHTFTGESDYIAIGTPTPAFLASATGFEVRMEDKSTSREIIDDHTYQIQTQFTIIMDEGQIDGKVTFVDSIKYTQTIEHDVINGVLKISEREQKTRKLHEYNEFINGLDGNLALQLVFNKHISEIGDKTETVWVKDFMNYAQPEATALGYKEAHGDNLAVFLTSNTSETQAMVTKIDAQIKETSYDEKGNITSNTENNYESTDFSPSNIQVSFIIKLAD